MIDGDRTAGDGGRAPHRIGMALVCLHVSAGLYAVLGIASPWFFSWAAALEPEGPGRGFGTALGVAALLLCLVLVAGIELVAFGLRRRRFWAWVAGLCIFGLYTPSLFLPLGVLGLWGLLDAGSQRAFGVGRRRGGGTTGTARLTRLVSAVPALPVADLERGLAFYRERLGFVLLHREQGFAVLRRDGVELHLWAATDERWRERGGGEPVVSGAESFIAGTASCRIGVVGVDALAAELAPHGIAHPNAPLADKPWGTREFGVLDPDGNLITFFEGQSRPMGAAGR